MPALLAYLLSIAIFVGGAYAGLVWLTEPVESSKAANSTASSTVARSQRSKIRSPIKEKQPKPEAPFETKADRSDESQGGNASASGSKNAKTETGVEHSDNPAVREPQEAVADFSSSPAQSGPSNPTQTVTLQNDSGRGSGLAAEQPPVSVRKPAATADAVHPMKPRPKIAKKPEVHFESDSAPEVRTAQRKPDQRSSNDDKLKSGIGEQASRSGLVLMTLRTIEFPDGHRERRLVPLRGDIDPDF